MPLLIGAPSPSFAVEELAPADTVKPEPRPAQPDDAPSDPAPAVPAPESRPAGAGEDAMAPVDAPIDAQDLPKPEPRPESPAEAAAKSAGSDKPVENADTPKSAAPGEVAKPAEPATAAPTEPATPAVPATKPAPVDLTPPPRASVMPDEEKACRARLTTLGVKFEERDQLADKAGCSVPWPIAITTVSATIPLEPEAVVNCATAEAMAKFTAETIAPAARSILDATVEKIRHDSAYVCRPRNGTRKLSEHAFGNAIDFGAFTLSDKRVVTVGSAASRAEGEFMLVLRLAACGPFTTVLGPGSDADHASHFHFDLAKRRPGSTFCQ